ncbi:hypothetical protein SNEBB_011336 [Seison nebaliae]|nr:hypothetical protein SNEBB_011336 [Seison nebaliae]
MVYLHFNFYYWIIFLVLICETYDVELPSSSLRIIKDYNRNHEFIPTDIQLAISTLSPDHTQTSQQTTINARWSSKVKCDNDTQKKIDLITIKISLSNTKKIIRSLLRYPNDTYDGLLIVKWNQKYISPLTMTAILFGNLNHNNLKEYFRNEWLIILSVELNQKYSKGKCITTVLISNRLCIEWNRHPQNNDIDFMFKQIDRTTTYSFRNLSNFSNTLKIIIPLKLLPHFPKFNQSLYHMSGRNKYLDIEFDGRIFMDKNTHASLMFGVFLGHNNTEVTINQVNYPPKLIIPIFPRMPVGKRVLLKIVLPEKDLYDFHYYATAPKYSYVIKITQITSNCKRIPNIRYTCLLKPTADEIRRLYSYQYDSDKQKYFIKLSNPNLFKTYHRTMVENYEKEKNLASEFNSSLDLRKSKYLQSYVNPKKLLNRKNTIINFIKKKASAFILPKNPRKIPMHRFHQEPVSPMKTIKTYFIPIYKRTTNNMSRASNTLRLIPSKENFNFFLIDKHTPEYIMTHWTNFYSYMAWYLNDELIWSCYTTEKTNCTIVTKFTKSTYQLQMKPTFSSILNFRILSREHAGMYELVAKERLCDKLLGPCLSPLQVRFQLIYIVHPPRIMRLNPVPNLELLKKFFILGGTNTDAVPLTKVESENMLYDISQEDMYELHKHKKLSKNCSSHYMLYLKKNFLKPSPDPIVTRYIKANDAFSVLSAVIPWMWEEFEKNPHLFQKGYPWYNSESYNSFVSNHHSSKSYFKFWFKHIIDEYRVSPKKLINFPANKPLLTSSLKNLKENTAVLFQCYQPLYTRLVRRDIINLLKEYGKLPNLGFDSYETTVHSAYIRFDYDGFNQSYILYQQQFSDMDERIFKNFNDYYTKKDNDLLEKVIEFFDWKSKFDFINGHSKTFKIFENFKNFNGDIPSLKEFDYFIANEINDNNYLKQSNYQGTYIILTTVISKLVTAADDLAALSCDNTNAMWKLFESFNFEKIFNENLYRKLRELTKTTVHLPIAMSPRLLPCAKNPHFIALKYDQEDIKLTCDVLMNNDGKYLWHRLHDSNYINYVTPRSCYNNSLDICIIPKNYKRRLGQYICIATSKTGMDDNIRKTKYADQINKQKKLNEFYPKDLLVILNENTSRPIIQNVKTKITVDIIKEIRAKKVNKGEIVKQHFVISLTQKGNEKSCRLPSKSFATYGLTLILVIGFISFFIIFYLRYILFSNNAIAPL